MTFSAKYWKPRGSPAAGRSDDTVTGACPPVVDYGAELQGWAAAEVETLPADSALTDMLSDYSVLRDQVRASRAP